MGQIDGTEMMGGGGRVCKGRGELGVMICGGEICLYFPSPAHTFTDSRSLRASHRQVRGLMPCCNSGKSMLLKHLAMPGDEVQSE